MLPTEHHGACWELLCTAARDMLACRQGEALGRHCGDCVGQRDGSLVHLWAKRHPRTIGRKSGHSCPQVRNLAWSVPFPSLAGVYLSTDLSVPLPQAPEGRKNPLGIREGLPALPLIHCVVPEKALFHLWALTYKMGLIMPP